MNATTPLFGALVAALWLGERLTLRKLGGLCLGLLGVAVLVGLSPLPLTSTLFLALGASLLAALSYGVGAAYTKHEAAGVSPLALATYSQLSAALVLLPTLAFSRPTQTPSLTIILSVLALALLSTALAYLLYFYLINEAGTLLLAEPLDAGVLVGFGIILGSVVLQTGGVAQRPAAARAPNDLG